ncbi:unnamed protein product [Dibothriocephalus latus]|uniref:Cytosol aminopeptidase domain-containing protein n=1 Tax=Dibothriocephalus latus TaxID=60516 RepID=A0A3P7QN13_DIBLA|nr:unnamed protein product [Dibothriocephalus latus]
MAFPGKDDNLDWAINYAKAIEEGRWVARDICGSDSERMSSENIVKYLKSEPDLKAITNVAEVSEAEYPLMAAVDRGNKGITRHEGKVVKMAVGEKNAKKVLLLVGKGITFDTGGYDLKVDFKGRDVQIITAATLTGHVVRCYKWITGAMENGPSKQAGFLKALRKSGDQISDMLETTDLKLIILKSQKPTHDQGMPNLLQYMESSSKSAQTLSNFRYRIYANEILGEMTLRKEDYDFNLTPLETEDYLQCNNAGSVSTPRGHQAPAAFMIQASGLDAHGIDSDEPIRFAHLDVAGSAGLIDTVPTAAPMTMLTNHYLMKPAK